MAEPIAARIKANLLSHWSLFSMSSSPTEQELRIENHEFSREYISKQAKSKK
jgi:hypothetical protein